MAKTIASFLAIYITLCAVILFGVAHLRTPFNLEEYLKLAGIGVAVLTSLMAAVASLLGVGRQIEAARKLEVVKESLSKDLESVKRRLGAEAKAFEELNGAASAYYYALADLEVGSYDPVAADEADKGMVKARRVLSSISKKQQDLWQKFWQKARFIKEVAAAGSPTQEDRKKIWATNVGNLGSLLRAFEASVTKEIRNT